MKFRRRQNRTTNDAVTMVWVSAALVVGVILLLSVSRSAVAPRPVARQTAVVYRTRSYVSVQKKPRRRAETPTALARKSVRAERKQVEAVERPPVRQGGLLGALPVHRTPLPQSAVRRAEALIAKARVAEEAARKVAPAGRGRRRPRGGAYADYDVWPQDLLTDTHSYPGGKMPYSYFVPDQGRLAGKKVPLILFLHGLGDCGRNQLKHKQVLTFVQSKNQEEYPCFFVAPQLSSRSGWASASYDPLPSLSAAVAIVDGLSKKYPTVDTNRIYVTGLSSGGTGAFDAVAKFPSVFAAAVPISASWDPCMFRGEQNVAVWAFYTKQEKTYVKNGCDQLLQHIEDNGGLVRKTVYPRGGHNAWQWAYFEKELTPWLFRQRLNPTSVCQVSAISTP